MTEQWFQISVVVGVWLACLVFIVQAGVAIALLRRITRLQDKVSPLIERATPVIGKLEPVLERASVMIEKAAPLMEQAGPTIAKIGPVLEQVAPLMAKAGPVIEKVGPLVVSAEQFLSAAGRLVEETRPKVAEISAEVLAIAKSGREQVEHLGAVLNEAGGLARTRLEQIDHSVESTVEQVEAVSGAVKRAVMLPVREVNGLAAGISAAVSTLVKGQHRPSVATATQDEEMFI